MPTGPAVPGRGRCWPSRLPYGKQLPLAVAFLDPLAAARRGFINLEAAQLTAEQWRKRWEAERWFLTADGESGKRF